MSIKNIVNAQVAKVTQYNPTTGLVDGLATSGNITANTGAFFIGDGGLLSNISGGGGTPSAIANGTGTLSIAANSGNLSVTNTGGSGDASLNFNNDAVAIGYQSGQTSQGLNAVAIGYQSGQTGQGLNAVAIGANAGTLNQPANSIMLNASAISLNGTEAGFYVNPIRSDIGNVATALYYNSATYELTFAPTVSATVDWANVSNKSGSSGPDTVAVGNGAALLGTQGANSVAIGTNAGRSNQDENGVAIGTFAGSVNQSTGAVAVGASAGLFNQGANSVAIGPLAGQTSQPANSIMINAGETSLNGTEQGFYVNPVRNDTGNTTNVIYYNTTTNEVTYGPAAATYGNADVSLYLASGLDTAGIETAGDIDAGGNITASGNIIGTNVGNAATVLRGDGGLISNISVSAGTFIINGTSGVAIDGVDGNIDLTIAGFQFGTISSTQIAIGNQTGTLGSANSIAIGTFAGYFADANTVAIGLGAGQGHPVSSTLGANSVAIGANASRGGLGIALPGNTIVINATGANLNPTQASSFFVAPVRTANIGGGMLAYDSTTKEVMVGIPQLPAFADLTAMTSAVASPVAGMMAYDTGNNRPAFYDGTAWTDL